MHYKQQSHLCKRDCTTAPTRSASYKINMSQTHSMNEIPCFLYCILSSQKYLQTTTCKMCYNSDSINLQSHFSLMAELNVLVVHLVNHVPPFLFESDGWLKPTHQCLTFHLCLHQLVSISCQGLS